MKTTFLITLLVNSIIVAQINFAPLQDSTKEVVYHQNYILQYNETYEQPDWVFYELTSFEVLNGSYDRTDNFRSDPLILAGSASLDDYRGSGYDRGHLAPAGDMAFSHTAMSESFYLSNMSPQNPSFNRGRWKRLESLVRNWAVDNKGVYVVTAGDLTEVESTIGLNKVGVPSYYYKVILDYEEPQIKAIAFYLPNEKGTRDIQDYAVSIDYVEERTGIDFFYALPDSVENTLESTYDVTQWNFSSSSSKSYSKNKYFSDTVSKININTATAEELDQLYGIGTSKAQAIIAARPYKSVDEITRAYGIGPKTLEKIRPYITVGDPNDYVKAEPIQSAAVRININTASRSELQSLPGMGKVIAGRIISARPFTKIEQLMNVKGIGQGRFNKIKDRVTVR